MPDPNRPFDLVAVVEVAAAQVALMQSVAGRRDVDHRALRGVALDMILKGLRTAADAQRAGAAPEAQRTLAAFVAQVDAYEAANVQATQSLLDMTADWTCPHCGADVAKTAHLSSVTGSKAAVRVEIVCAACGQRSPVTEAGRKVFEQRFGHLVGARWNPELNGFAWDGR